MLKKKLQMTVIATIISLMVMFHFSFVFATDESATVNQNEILTDEITGEADTQGDIMPISEGTGTDAIATEEDVTTQDDASSDASTEAEPETYSDDLYIIDNNVVMDQLVDGNAYILANTVTITGQVNGNLYVCANEINFDNSYIRYSIYACANTINFNGACNDLYAACKKMNVTYDSYIVRDVRVASDSIAFAGLVGRNANFLTNSLTLSTIEAQKDADGNIVKDENGNEATEEKLALIYGNLNYNAPSEITVPEEVVEGAVNYNLINNMSTTEGSTFSIILAYAINLISCIIFTLIVFILFTYLLPKFMEKSSEFVSGKMAIGLLIGIVSIIVAMFIFFLLMFSVVATTSAFAFITAYILLASLGFSVVSICFANKFAKDGKLGKKVGYLLIVTIILWALKQIPYVGGYIGLIITFAGLGTLLLYAFTKNKESISLEKKD